MGSNVAKPRAVSPYGFEHVLQQTGVSRVARLPWGSDPALGQRGFRIAGIPAVRHGPGLGFCDGAEVPFTSLHL